MIGTTRAPQAAPRARRAAEGGSLELEPIDGRLPAAGLTLEHQLLPPGERLVLGRLDGSSTVAVPVQDLRWPARADVLPSGPVREAIASAIGIRALMVVSDQRRCMRRLELRNEDGKTVARVELDEPASVSAVAASPAQLTVRAGRYPTSSVPSWARGPH